MYLRSKGDGEKVVRDSALATTIFRSSVVFGPEDNLLNQFAFLERMFPVIPLACADAQFQPVFVGDVAKAIVNVLDLDAASGRVYELAGPQRLHARGTRALQRRDDRQARDASSSCRRASAACRR